MEINEQIMEMLDTDKDAKVLPSLAGGLLSYSAGSWALDITGVEGAEESCVNWVLDMPETSRPANWGILLAKYVDETQDSFLPRRARAYMPIYAESTWCSTPDIVSRAKSFDELMEYMEASDVPESSRVDLTAMYLEGLGRPVYVQGKNGKRSQDASVFYFYAAGGITAIRGPVLRALSMMGLRVVLDPSVSQLRIESGTSLVGALTRDTPSGITETPDGRSVFYDISDISWVTADEALLAFADAGCHSPRSMPESIADLSTEASRCRKSVGVLRWRGWSDAEIWDAYMRARPTALRKHIELAAEDIEEFLSMSPTCSGWEKSRKTRRAADAVRVVDVAQEELGYQVTLPGLTAVRQALEEV